MAGLLVRAPFAVTFETLLDGALVPLLQLIALDVLDSLLRLGCDGRDECVDLLWIG